jgi:transporter family-2 protein
VATTLNLLVAFALGTTTAVQLALIAAMGRAKGPEEGATISAVGTTLGLAALLLASALAGRDLALPQPFDGVALFALAAPASALLLLGAMRGLRPAYAFTGLNAVFVLVAIAILVPRVGVALFFSAFTLGSVASALLLDHLGAFGAERRSASLRRMAGVALVAAGVIAVRIGA